MTQGWTRQPASANNRCGELGVALGEFVRFQVGGGGTREEFVGQDGDLSGGLLCLASFGFQFARVKDNALEDRKGALCTSIPFAPFHVCITEGLLNLLVSDKQSSEPNFLALKVGAA